MTHITKQSENLFVKPVPSIGTNHYPRLLPSKLLSCLTNHNFYSNPDPNPTSHAHSPFGASPVMGKPTGQSKPKSKAKGKAKAKSKAKAKGQEQGTDGSSTTPRDSQHDAHGGKSRVVGRWG